VHSARAGDPELGTELERLLASHEKLGSFLEAEPAALAPPPDRIGPYELLREIGHGGMGTVYLAARADDEYRQRVALKLIRRGMDTDLVVSRFRNERQILASLNHPNIASLLDGGTTPDGLPYLVMEHVDGQPIDRYCDARRLPIRERLELFLLVCGAVQHAHASLVVHRDLKPGNILVSADGQPKLLDFGLAKLVDPEVGADQTATQQRFLTPSYASPEQIQGRPITTASDVYSLGVLLYLLLTGHRPYGSETSSAQEMSRAVCETEPTRPSAAVLRGSEAETRAAARSATPRGLRRKLNGDLDAIILKALRKEPERRFASVEGLTADLRRHLAGRPVSARAGTTWYLASRFVATHRAGVLATALVVFSLAGGLVETSRQRARAERRFAEVRELANSFLFEIHDAIEYLPGSTKARELLIERARTHLDGLAREAGGDRALQLELAAAYEKLGDVLGRYGGSNLGRTPEALASYRKALGIRVALVAETKGDAQERLVLARNYSRIGEILLTRSGDPPGALETLKRSLAIREALARDEPGNREAQYALSVSYFEIGSTLQDLGDRTAALANFRNALAIRELLVKAHPDSVRFQRGLGNNYGQIGEALQSDGDLAGAADAYRRALSLFEAVLDREPANTSTRLALQQAWQALGMVDAQRGNVQAALQNYRNALDICEKLAAADPANVEPRRRLAQVLSRIGDAFSTTGSAAEALASQQRALAVAEGYAARDSADPLSRLDLATYQRAVGLAQAGAGDGLASLESLRKALTVAEALAGGNPASADFREAVALCQVDIARVSASLASAPAPAAHRLEHWRQARAFFQKSLDGWTDLKRSGLLKQSDAGHIEEAARGVALADKALGRFSH
jgi:eukaryotic-like serine/threonine-protein kinase